MPWGHGSAPGRAAALPRRLPNKVASLRQPAKAPSEAIANVTLAYRHLEDASMRLGKAIQALDGGRNTKPYASAQELGFDIKSTPYDGRFGDEWREEMARDYGDHPDGPILRLTTEILHDV
jgi:hypothetical protein